MGRLKPAPRAQHISRLDFGAFFKRHPAVVQGSLFVIVDEGNHPVSQPEIRICSFVCFGAVFRRGTEYTDITGGILVQDHVLDRGCQDQLSKRWGAPPINRMLFLRQLMTRPSPGVQLKKPLHFRFWKAHGTVLILPPRIDPDPPSKGDTQEPPPDFL